MKSTLSLNYNTGTYLQGKSMEYFDMESRGVPWKILRVYFAMETPWV